MLNRNFLTDLSRRDALKLAAAGVTGASLSGWLNVLAAQGRAEQTAPSTRRASCCGWTAAPATRTPSTSSPAPPTAARSSRSPPAPGHPDQRALPEVRQADEPRRHLARHDHRRRRARPRQLPHAHRLPRRTGRRRLSRLGSIVSKELGRPEFPLPNFVTIGGIIAPTAPASSGTHYQPLIVTDPARGVENLKPIVASGAVRQPGRSARGDGEGLPPRLQGRRGRRPTAPPISAPSR